MIYILLLSELILFIIAMTIEREDILAPSCIVCLVWIFSTLCAIYNIDTWKIDLHPNTVFVILIGLITFIVSSFFAKYSRNLNIKINKYEETMVINSSIVPIKVYWFGVYIVIAIGVIAVLWQVLWLKSTVGGAGSWLMMMKDYRSSSSSWNTNTISKSSVLSNLEFFLKVSAYITSYIGINNIFSDKFRCKMVILFIPGVLFVIDQILNAGRGDILYFIAAILIITYIIMQRKNNWRRKISRKYIKYLFIVTTIVLVLFSTCRELVGRTDDSSGLYYITSYAGGSIQLFDMYLQDPIEKSEIIGKETFSTLNNILGEKLNITKLKYIEHLEFRYSNGLNIGNIYGTFRYYIQDFGYLGLIILTSFSAIYHTKMYKWVKLRKYTKKDGVDWLVLLYMLFSPALFMHSIADFTYSDLFNITRNIKWFLFAWIMVFICVDNKKINCR